MLKAYLTYRDWWQRTSAICGEMSDDMQSDETFEEHVNSMTLFEFMETLDLWRETDD